MNIALQGHSTLVVEDTRPELHSGAIWFSSVGRPLGQLPLSYSSYSCNPSVVSGL